MRRRERKGQRERGRGTARGGKGVMTARGAVSPFSVLPPNHETSLSMTTATPLYLISPTGSAIPAHTVEWHLNTLNVPGIEYGNGGGPSANCFVAVQDQWQPHISTVKTVITPQHYNSKYFLHDMNNNHNSNNTQVAILPYSLRWLII